MDWVKSLWELFTKKDVSLSPPSAPPIVPVVRTPPVQGWSKDISDCHSSIQQAFPRVKTAWDAAHPDMPLRVDYTWRSPAIQFELYKKGRALTNGAWVVVDPKQVVTEKDGFKDPGQHNVYPSQAADIYITKGGQILWGQKPEETPLYVELGRLWEKEGLVSGMTWKYHWKDPDHVQVAYQLV